MNSIHRIVAVFLVFAVVYGTWATVEFFLLTPKRSADFEIRELQSEIAGLVERGSAALSELQLTPPLPPGSEPGAEPTVISDLQQIARDAVVTQGADLISSQSAEGGRQVLVRARFTEEALLGFVRSIEVAPGGNRFLSLDVQPVPLPQMGTALEVTALISAMVQSAN